MINKRIGPIADSIRDYGARKTELERELYGFGSDDLGLIGRQNEAFRRTGAIPKALLDREDAINREIKTLSRARTHATREAMFAYEQIQRDLGKA